MNKEVAKAYKELAHGVSLHTSSGTVVEVYKSAIEPDTESRLNTNLGDPWALWGTDNDYAQRMIDENMQEAISAGCLAFKIAAHYGGGLYFYTKSTVGDKEVITPIPKENLPQEIQDFIFNNDIENFQQTIVAEFEWHNRYLVQYIPNALRNKILKIKAHRTKDYRKAKRDINTGEVKNYYLSGYWPSPINGEWYSIPSFDKTNPFSIANGAYEHSIHSVDKDYYGIPLWQANMRWVSLAKKIPRWIHANIDNALNLKYHIRIPQEYFEHLHPRDRYDTDEAWIKAMMDEESSLKASIDTLLTGADNVAKTFYSKIAIGPDGTPLPGWEFIPIANEIKDEAWLNTYGTAGAAICSAHGVPLSLASMILSAGLGSGSGSDVREQFNYYTQLRTAIPRQTTLEPWEFIKRFNKWPQEIHMGYKNIVLQTLDENKSGFANQNEPRPTSARK